MQSLSQTQKQQIVQKVVCAIQKQGAPGFEDGTCVWKDKQGNRCAIGHLLTQDQLERLGRRDIHEDYITGNVEEYIDDEHFDDDAARFLGGLQEAHDEAVELDPNENVLLERFLRKFPENMQALCQEWDLDYPKEIQ